ncbi:MAG: hypothetical protein IJF46_07435 [Bacteroidaceae bacterium]|nr:hypothetical protein [Bacteroidaceae bacterium]
MSKKLLLIIGLIFLFVGASAKRVGVYCYFANDGSQLYEDNNVRVELTMENTNLVLAIYNKTDDALYIDSENSFIYNNENIVGSLRSKKQFKSEEQPVLIIAPGSRIVLCTWKNLNIMFDKTLIKRHKCFGRGSFVDSATGKKEKFVKWLSRSYTKERTPFSVRGIIEYSKNKNLESTTKATVSNYITDIIIDSYKGVKDPGKELPNCRALKDRPSDYSFVSGKAWTTTKGGMIVLTMASFVITNVVLFFTI